MSYGLLLSKCLQERRLSEISRGTVSEEQTLFQQVILSSSGQYWHSHENILKEKLLILFTSGLLSEN